ncbi:MAG TPA: hypothetical protein VGY76_09845 [Solirubrobacteraceae bacterium]|jgi:hypothetical protein|nr:hypothetical protein [Solirubrobacteraceae bacterium]
MTRRVTILMAVALTGSGLVIAAVAWAAQTLTARLTFTPDRLGASTSLSVKAEFHSPAGGVPAPVRKVTAYLPAGLEIDLRGAGICDATRLQEGGPEACPADSRLGYGGGTGLLELAGEVIREPFTLDLFAGPSEGGRLVILAYVNASSPASYQIVVAAKEIHAAKPYGLGFTFEVPLIPTLPGASDASIASASFTLGDNRAAYFKRIHGRKKLVHIRGIVVPKSCPRRGFPYAALISFADNSALTYTGTIRCPG